MIDSELKLECLKLATAVCLASHDKSFDAIATLSTQMYDFVVTARETSADRTLSLNKKR